MARRVLTWVVSSGVTGLIIAACSGANTDSGGASGSGGVGGGVGGQRSGHAGAGGVSGVGGSAAAVGGANTGHGGAAGSGGTSAEGGASNRAGTGGIGDATDQAGAGGVGGASEQAGAGGIGGVSDPAGGDAGAAGRAVDPRWLDPGPGNGCGPTGSANCGGTLSWGCVSPPTSSECQPVSAGASQYCCSNTACIRDWPDDEAFCPGSPILINCEAGVAAPARCTPYGTSITMWCCEP